MRIIIVGGGITGLMLAAAVTAFSDGMIHITLVEEAMPDLNQYLDFDRRVIALAYNTCKQLDYIGVWSELKKFAAPIHNIEVSVEGLFGLLNIYDHHYDIPYLGQVLELQQARACLFNFLIKKSNVTIVSPGKVVSVVYCQNNAHVVLQNGSSLEAELLVAADGTRSFLVSHSHIPCQKKDYGQLAIVADIFPQKVYPGMAFECLTKKGLLAMLPVNEKNMSFVWCNTINKQLSIMDDSDDVFLSELQQVFGWRLGKLRALGKRRSYTPQLVRAARHIDHRLALVGNAVQTLHPIAAQGFNLASRDVMTLAKVVSVALKKGQDIGSYTVLNEYQQCRIADQQRTIRMTDELIHCFSQNWLPIVIVRQLGLSALILFPVLRSRIVNQMLGWSLK